LGKHSARKGRRRVFARNKDNIFAGRRSGNGILEPSPPLRVDKERKKQRRHRIMVGIVLALLACAIGTVVYGYDFVRSVESEMHSSVEEDDRVEEVLTDREKHEPFTVLLLGSDERDGEEAARADTIILMKIDPETQNIWMLSIPRDTRVDIPGVGVSKVNAANFYGGPALMIETIQEFTGIPVNHYMELDFLGFEGIVDALGGVWIDVPREVDDWKAASHSPNHQASHIDAGYQLLDGEYALTFVRSRDYPDADFTRMQNQQLFFRALLEQATRWSNILKLPGTIREFARYTNTDMSVGELIEIAQALNGVNSAGLETATLLGEWRSPYVVVDEDEMERLVTAMRLGESFNPSAHQESEGEPSDVSVAVRNGGGITGIAQDCADILETEGFDIVEVGDANQFVYEKTLIVYHESEEDAWLVANAFGIGDVVPSRGLYMFNADVLVVAGKDWVKGEGPSATFD